MKIRRFFLFFIFAGMISAGLSTQAWSLSSEDAAQFEKANNLYREKQFLEASRIYEVLSSQYPKTAAFYFNLGNSQFRSRNIGKSILAYERALMLDPRNSDIQNNLAYVRGQLEYRIDDKRNWYIRAGEKALQHFTEEEIRALFLLSFALFAMSWSFVLFFSKGDKSWGWKRKTLLGMTILFFLLAIAKQIETSVIRDAVVMNKEAQVRYGPSDTDRLAFKLGEGLKVFVVDHREDWSRIILVNGEGGWVKSDQIAEVRV